LTDLTFAGISIHEISRLSFKGSLLCVSINISPTSTSFYVVKQEAGDLFLFFLSLYGKSEEEVSSAGEQLTSNRVYDGENTREGLS
jgi:hypothetical protein